jgi:hypothetical protein
MSMSKIINSKLKVASKYTQYEGNKEFQENRNEIEPHNIQIDDKGNIKDITKTLATLQDHPCKPINSFQCAEDKGILNLDLCKNELNLTNLQYEKDFKKQFVGEEDKTLDQDINEILENGLEHVPITPLSSYSTIDSLNSDMKIVLNPINDLQNKKRQGWLKNEQIDIMSQSNQSEIRSSTTSLDHIDFENEICNKKNESIISDSIYNDEYCIFQRDIYNKLGQERFCNEIGQINSSTFANNLVNDFELQPKNSKGNSNLLNFEENNHQQLSYCKTKQIHSNKSNDQSNKRKNHNDMFSLHDNIYDEQEYNSKKIEQSKIIDSNAHINPSNLLNTKKIHNIIVMQQNVCNKKMNEFSKHCDVSPHGHKIHFTRNHQKNVVCCKHQDDIFSQKMHHINTPTKIPFSCMNFEYDNDSQNFENSLQKESKAHPMIPDFHMSQFPKKLNQFNDLTNINLLNNPNVNIQSFLIQKEKEKYRNQFDGSLANNEHKVIFSMQSVRCVHAPSQKNQIDFDQRCNGFHSLNGPIYNTNENNSNCHSEHCSDDYNNLEINEAQRIYHHPQMIDEGHLRFVDLEEGIYCNPCPIQQYEENFSNEFRNDPSNYYLPTLNDQSIKNVLDGNRQYVGYYSNDSSTFSENDHDPYNDCVNYNERNFDEFDTNENNQSDNSKASTIDHNNDKRGSIMDYNSDNSRKSTIDYNSDNSRRSTSDFSKRLINDNNSNNNRQSTIEHPNDKRMSTIDHYRRSTLDPQIELTKQIELRRSVSFQNDLKTEVKNEHKKLVSFKNKPGNEAQNDIRESINPQKSLEKEAQFEINKSIALQTTLQSNAQLETKEDFLDELEDEFTKKLKDSLDLDLEGMETSLLELLSQSEAEMESLKVQAKGKRIRGDISPNPHAEMEGYKKRIQGYKRIREEKRRIMLGVLSGVVDGNLRQATTFKTCGFCNMDYSENLESIDTNNFNTALVTDEELHKLIKKNELESIKLAEMIQFTLNAISTLPNIY